MARHLWENGILFLLVAYSTTVIPLLLIENSRIRTLEEEQKRFFFIPEWHKLSVMPTLSRMRAHLYRRCLHAFIFYAIMAIAFFATR